MSISPPSTYHAFPFSVANENPISLHVFASVADIPGSRAVVSVSNAIRSVAISVERSFCASASVAT